ncbi:hypothetical protein LCGC14_2303220, partial [marine sediment metagenome]
VSGSPRTLERAGVSLDGTDDKIDFGDVGNIQQVSMWVKPGSVTEQIVLVDTGAYIHLVAGTVAYVNLTASATYVNSVASSTLAADEWQYLVCQFTQVDANNLELGWDGAAYGEIDVMDFRAHDEQKTAGWVSREYQTGVPDDALLLHVFDGSRDLSRHERTLTRSGGVIVGHDMTFDDTDDKIDCGDLGNVQTIMGWVRPGSDTEEIWLVDAGNDVMVSGGTVTYAGLTPVATYVNGVATTAMVADVWQHLACVVSTVDANNFELGWDGANYGDTEQRDVRVYSDIKASDWIALYYARTRGYF